MKKRTALFGGSFDPIHIGHAMVANHLTQSGEVDELWLMPSRLNPLKAGTVPASPEHRMAMCRLVAQRCRDVDVCDIELAMPEPSYTVDTLRELRERFPDREFVLLIGSDNWLVFDRWYKSEEILANHDIIIYPRPDYMIDPRTLPPNVHILDKAPQALISSTYVRNGIRHGDNMNFFVPRDVLEYVKNHKLYE